jgi:anti-sigma factor RsiW
MTGKSLHCTSADLQLLMDGRISGAEREKVHAHLQECVRCRMAYQSMAQLDRGLRKMPVAAASNAFTEKVMEKVVPSSHLPFAFRIVENLAYVFAALIVTGLVTTLFIATGVIDSGQVTEGQGKLSAYSSAAGSWLAQVIHGGTGWLERYFPLKAGTPHVLLVGVGILAGFALLDRLLSRLFAQRTR